MGRRMRFVLPVLVIVLGLAVGLYLNSAIGGRSSADPCFGTGALQSTIVVEPTPGVQAVLNDCQGFGHRTVLDAKTGSPIAEDLLDQQVADYYAEHPDENPRVIAEKTAAAQFAVDSFTPANAPTPVAKTPHDCPPGTLRTTFPDVGASLCVPDGWKLFRVPGDTHFGSADNLAQIGVFPKSVTSTAGTRCANPDLVTLATGVMKICAFKPNALGGQGHGFVLPVGREGGINLLEGVSSSDRDLVFQVAYSVEDE